METTRGIRRHRSEDGSIPHGYDFHSKVIAVIGKRFGDGGLSDLLIEGGIVAASSMSGVLAGRQYNRAMRAHKIVMEAMQRLRLKSFKEWLEENKNDAYKESTEELDIVLANLSADTLTAMLASPECKRLLGRVLSK